MGDVLLGCTQEPGGQRGWLGLSSRCWTTAAHFVAMCRSVHRVHRAISLTHSQSVYLESLKSHGRKQINTQASLEEGHVCLPQPKKEKENSSSRTCYSPLSLLSPSVFSAGRLGPH